MEKFRYQFERLSLLIRTGIFFYEEGCLEEYRSNAAFTPIRDNESFRGKLLKMTQGRKVPLLYQDAWQIVYIGIWNKGQTILAGPVSLKNLTPVELRRYYREYGIRSGLGRAIPTYPLSVILAIVQMMAKDFTGMEYAEEMILSENNMKTESEEQIEKEQLIFEIREEEKERYHHTYQEERMLLECVKEGKPEEAVKYSGDMDMGLGRMAHKDLTHWRNMAVVAITLCVRAAIEGGINPAEAYQLSDFYIQKTENCSQVSDLLELRNCAVRDLANRVRRKLDRGKRSNYVEQCVDYISSHYKEKIYLQDMAERMGLSSTYLSRLFSREMGMCMQDYINSFRVERAANLLIYSEESIAYIAEYVNFPSQSYLGKMFQKYKHMTPKEYRDTYKPAEFTTMEGKITRGDKK